MKACVIEAAERRVRALKDFTHMPFFRSNSKPQPGKTGHKGPLPKNPSLLFDIELEDSLAAEPSEQEGLQDLLQRVRLLEEPWTVQEKELKERVEVALERCKEQGEGSDNARFLAQQLLEQGYQVKLRTALGGCATNSSCLRNLRHVFLTCRLDGGKQGRSNVIIDPWFSDQFEIASPTPRYAALLQELQPVFVGTEERVSALVTLVCAEMEHSFQATSTALPPWRQVDSMLTKWRPRRSMDSEVGACAGEAARAQQRADPPSLKPAPAIGSRIRHRVNISAFSSATGSAAAQAIARQALQAKRARSGPEAAPKEWDERPARAHAAALLEPSSGESSAAFQPCGPLAGLDSLSPPAPALLAGA